MKTIKKYITGLLAFLICSFLLAQEPAQELCTKNYYTYDYLLRTNFWLQANNAAGLIFNDKALDKTDSYTQFDGTVFYNGGDFRNIYTPESELQYKLNAKSYMKLGKIHLYGNFTYDYNVRRNIQWAGMLNPINSPFMLSDSIPGNQTLERFTLDGGIALPVNNNFTVGAYMDYTVASAAKLKDLRNKNTYMNLLLRPAILYHSANWNFGANLLYERTTEEIEYRQFEANTSNKSIFSLSGLWFYTYKTFSSSESRRKNSNKLGGAFQGEFVTGDLKIFSEFSGYYGKSSLSETGYNKQEYGDTKITAYRYEGKAVYKNQHRLTGYMEFSRMLGYNVIQRLEMNPDARVNQWVTYDRVNNYVRNAVEYEIAYTFDKLRSECNHALNLSLGARGYSIENAYKLYPLKYLQQWNYTEVFLNLNRNILYAWGMLDLNPSVAYGWGSGTMNDKSTMNGMTLQEVEEYMPPTEQPLQLTQQLAREFVFMTAGRLNWGLHCRATYFLNKSKGTNLYADIRYNYLNSMSDALRDKHRNYISLTIGLSL